ncbi:MAG TPA: family 16 glycosylhydrolase [Lacipirellulaceae bacterium]|jgi:beta-glucanase (GH16 family)
MAACRFVFYRLQFILVGPLWATCVLTLSATASGQVPDFPGWQLAWHDEFTGTSVNTNTWNVLNLQNSQNNEKQYYMPSQATIINNDVLRITASQPTAPVGGKSYLSARLESKGTFGPGSYFEARIDLPSGKGMWPAFWLNANAVQWPLGGEIDVMENKGRLSGDVSSAFHYQKNAGPCCGQHFYVVQDYVPSPAVDFQADFHKYAVDWENKQLKFYVDDHLTYTVNENAAMSDANFLTAKNIILNLAVGGIFDGDPDGTTTFPQFMDVDYVRMWQKQSGLVGDYNKDGVVDAGDYTVWRDSVGQSAIGLAADGSGNGTVDQSDYDKWQSNFGATASGSAAAANSGAVPEPGTFMLTVTALLSVIAFAARSAGRGQSQRIE